MLKNLYFCRMISLCIMMIMHQNFTLSLSGILTLRFFFPNEHDMTFRWKNMLFLFEEDNSEPSKVTIMSKFNGK